MKRLQIYLERNHKITKLGVDFLGELKNRETKISKSGWVKHPLKNIKTEAKADGKGG